ncbi:Crp/Fnr family transcriptional regulator [Helicobacter sp. MIT 00-7814]|uniref:Crp/Fnr family transcriptional regulator n=1 Tax=unclassified Helicobacter TaxID=2593540 RepID=UPI000E1F03B3|nr:MULTISPECIES: Crp/Fnr family transcriptional regulator [unclassified Helicobacter]RDU56158.1 Crp/Fnr family transcriptional regulator [Helicobacter sp. MIT 99-10781]RDU56255.1 Crp/Fnr family transcriptional regulator [Helicobacter sp. MIT 00-7814]
MEQKSLYMEILKSIGSKLSYTKDSILFYEGDTPKRLYVLLEGIVRLYKSDASGNEIIIHKLMPTSFIAEMPLFENLPYPASARFESDGVVLSVDFARFKQSLSKNPDLLVAFIGSLMGKIRILERKISHSILASLRARLAHYLLESKNTLCITNQRTIAQELNTTPQSLSRTIRELKDMGLISVSKGKITLLDIQGLVRLLDS